jgi:hypothetical protein
MKVRVGIHTIYASADVLREQRTANIGVTHRHYANNTGF